VGTAGSEGSERTVKALLDKTTEITHVVHCLTRGEVLNPTQSEGSEGSEGTFHQVASSIQTHTQMWCVHMHHAHHGQLFYYSDPLFSFHSFHYTLNNTNKKYRNTVSALSAQYGEKKGSERGIESAFTLLSLLSLITNREIQEPPCWYTQ
jgi:hypothetical protein